MERAAEERAGTTSSTAGGGFIPTGVPAYVGDHFAAAARAASRLAHLLPVEPLPASGMDIHQPRMTTGTVVAVQATQHSSVGTQDIVEANTSSGVATIAGYLDMSTQLFERSDPSAVDV